ncbi:unnamed protein product [Caretta caretta]
MKNEWKLELEVPGEPHGLALGGPNPSYAHLKEKQDKYMFEQHEVSYVYYREVETPPSSLLIPHFSRALRRLPPTCSLDMYRALFCHIRHPLREPGSTGGLMAIDSEVGCRGLLGLDGEPQSQPGWGSYSLLPIYTLVGPEDPRWEALRWVVKEYVAERRKRRSCPRGCPEGGYAISWDVCKC